MLCERVCVWLLILTQDARAGITAVSGYCLRFPRRCLEIRGGWGWGGGWGWVDVSRQRCLACLTLHAAVDRAAFFCNYPGIYNDAPAKKDAMHHRSLLQSGLLLLRCFIGLAHAALLHLMSSDRCAVRRPSTPTFLSNSVSSPACVCCVSEAVQATFVPSRQNS